MSLFYAQIRRPIFTKFCTDLHNNSGKVLNTSLTQPTRSPDPGVPQTPKPKQITGEKLCYTKNALNFFRPVPGPGWLVSNISGLTP